MSIKGDALKKRVSDKAYRDGYDLIFGKKHKEGEDEKGDKRDAVEGDGSSEELHEEES